MLTVSHMHYQNSIVCLAFMSQWLYYTFNHIGRCIKCMLLCCSAPLCSCSQAQLDSMSIRYFCYSLCLAQCDHVQKKRLLTWNVIMMSSSEIHAPITSHSQHDTCIHPWSGNCNKRLIRKRFSSYFHTLALFLGLYDCILCTVTNSKKKCLDQYYYKLSCALI